MAVRSPTRALAAILPQIAISPYSAHQKARTFASRYVQSNHPDVAIAVLFESARELLKTGEAGSGVDLAVFMLEVYEAKPEEITEESRGRLTQLIALTGSGGGWRKTLIDKAIAWTVRHGPHPAGDPLLHHYIGELLYKESSFDAAEPHLLASGSRDSARLLSEMFIRWSRADTASLGAFALHGVLPYLSDGNILAAHTFITHFISALPPASESESGFRITADPALNFAQLAVMACQRAAGEGNKAMRECWVRLCGTYQTRGGVLGAAEVRKVLTEIGVLYFALPPPRSQNANPFGDMLASMLGGGGSAPVRRISAVAALD